MRGKKSVDFIAKRAAGNIPQQTLWRIQGKARRVNIWCSSPADLPQGLAPTDNSRLSATPFVPNIQDLI